jgi:hypothetical protein
MSKVVYYNTNFRFFSKNREFSNIMKVKKYLIGNKNENRRLLAPVFHNDEKEYLLCNCCFVAIYQTTVPANGPVDFHSGHSLSAGRVLEPPRRFGACGVSSDL